MCVSGYAFSPLTTYGDETWHGGRGQGPIISEGHERSKVRSNFRLLGLSSSFRRVMRDRGQVQNAHRGGCLLRSREVKGQVKFHKLRWSLNLGRITLTEDTKCNGLIKV